ncbi:MAG TPA: LacI family DNA-binding transcriptional regulator [Propionibacteriaceae bacterium]|nr:LacI family DNA-binding transcriptional regulator [Propionibacteriaceae bacterium]
MAERRIPSIRDVAAMADVSHQTVSRVLNDPDRVSPPTRARVERAIDVLGFRPNVAARALRSHHSRVVGVLVASSSLFVAMDGLSALELELRRHGFRLLVAGVQGGDFAAMSRSVEPLLAYGVDALVVGANERSAGDLARELARRMPVVALQPGISVDDGLSSVAIDFDTGVAAVVEHLVAGGARRPVHVPGPQNLSTVQARITAWNREVTRRGLAATVAQPVLMTGQGGYDAGRRLIDEGLPDAVFAVNDLVALGLIRAFTEHGIRVPEDVAVVGVDDWPGGEHTTPSLSTLSQRFEELGEVGASLVVEAMSGAPPRTARIAPRLIVRESSAGPA